MSFRSKKWFHYVLIIFLMCTPLRLYGTQMVTESHCDSDEISAYSTADTVIFNVSPEPVQSSDSSVMSDDCCCCEQSACSSDCSIGAFASLLQDVSFTPSYTAVAESANITYLPIVRSLAPPSRPPLDLS